jgi:hypothetical protein
MCVVNSAAVSHCFGSLCNRPTTDAACCLLPLSLLLQGRRHHHQQWHEAAVAGGQDGAAVHQQQQPTGTGTRPRAQQVGWGCGRTDGVAAIFGAMWLAQHALLIPLCPVCAVCAVVCGPDKLTGTLWPLLPCFIPTPEEVLFVQRLPPPPHSPLPPPAHLFYCLPPCSPACRDQLNIRAQELGALAVHIEVRV